ncbi:MAG: type II toxin-antitoxin system HipA family toxin [Duganella sp.]
MNGIFVGTWSITPYGETLHYADEWIRHPSGRPLSRSLPFRPGNPLHTGQRVEAYFENLLPDSKEMRERIARRYKTASTEAFDLLAEIGRDCVGALQLFPAHMQPASPGPVQATPLNESEVAHILRVVVTPPHLLGENEDDEDDFRISIAGAQEKTALLFYQGQWQKPKGVTPTSHILKLPLGLVGNMRADMSSSVENEWLCSLILEAYGLPVARCEPMRFEDAKVLVVERFDRRWWGESSDYLLRLPQEDMCQATGTPPGLKYENEGGPGVEDIMQLLQGSSHRNADRLLFFQSQVIFWMLCATDGHAKNFSIFLNQNDTFAMTPLYDVLSAYPILGAGPNKLSPFKAKMAMAVRLTNTHYKMREILRRHWIAIGERYGIVTPDGRPVAQVLEDLVERTPAVIKAVRAQLPSDFPGQVAEPIFAGLQDAANQLAGA